MQKKTHRKNNDPISTKSAQKVTKTRPTREGKGGIQDGILLEKKKNIAKTRPTAGKGCMREGYTQTVTQAQHAPAVGRTRPGGEFWAPVGSLLVPFGSLLVHFFSADVAEVCRFLASHLLASSGPGSRSEAFHWKSLTLPTKIVLKKKSHCNLDFS